MSEHTEPASYFFEAYFHQDCLRDDPDWKSVVQRFKDTESPERTRSTREALLDLLADSDDRGLEDFLFGSGPRSFYNPSREGLTVRAWIEKIVHLLAGGSPNDSAHAQVSSARRQAALIAGQILTGEKDVLLGARELASLRFAIDVPENDPDFTCFVAIDSETDALPLGAVRSQWEPDALHQKDAEITRSRSWAREFGKASFVNVVRRFGNAG